jgi:hypothetical protein
MNTSKSAIVEKEKKRISFATPAATHNAISKGDPPPHGQSILPGKAAAVG